MCLCLGNHHHELLLMFTRTEPRHSNPALLDPNSLAHLASLCHTSVVQVLIRESPIAGGVAWQIEKGVDPAPTDIYEHMALASKRGALMACSFGKSESDEPLDHRLLSSHAYSITAVEDVEIDGKSPR